MNDLLRTMASDMGIVPYKNESAISFEYRVCYSALGQWCLHIAAKVSNDNCGTSKNNQTGILNELLDKFKEIFPSISESFTNPKPNDNVFPAHIRIVYEETGYFLGVENNRNQLANYGRSISMMSASLLFGIPEYKYVVCGLGVLTQKTENAISMREFLIRDEFNVNEYIASQFDPIDFTEMEIDIHKLEFFNPLSRKSPSESWEKRLAHGSNFTLARHIEHNTYYKIIKETEKTLFVDITKQPDDSFTSYEYRRITFALKAYYKNPVMAKIEKLDSNYSKISLGGYLPNREYYAMLLISWPIGVNDNGKINAFSKNVFLINNNLLSDAAEMIKNIGIKTKGE